LNIIFKRERFLHVLRSADPAREAAAGSVARLALAHFRNGQQADAVSLDMPSATCLEKFPLSIVGRGSPTTRWGFSPRLGPWLRGRRSAYHAVILHGSRGHHARVTWRALHGGRTPYFLVPHGEMKGGKIWRGARRLLGWPCVLRDATGVIFSSEAEKECAKRSFPLDAARVHVVPDRDPDAFVRAVGDMRPQ